MAGNRTNSYSDGQPSKGYQSVTGPTSSRISMPQRAIKV